jgi:glycosyltransferase involved in cell wall biosynthesis
MGGGATRAYNIAKGLALSGCEVTVVTAFPHYPSGNIPTKYHRHLMTIETDGNLKIIRTFVPPMASEGITKRIFLFLSFVCSSLSALPVAGKVDAVFASNPNIIAVIPSLIYKLLNHCPVVQNVDDLWPEALYDLGINNKSLIAKLGEFMARVSYRCSSVITPISPAYVNVLTRKYNVSSKKAVVLRAGVDLSIFPKKDILRSKNKKFRVLYIGAFSPAYDFDQIFNCARLLTSYQDIEFIIQGGGELASTLQSKINGTNKPTNLKVVEKIISRREVAGELVNADVLILPLNGIGSIEMGISSKLYEYQAAGKPIICCSNGQPGRYVLDTNCGIVIKPGDYMAIAKAVLDLRANPDLNANLGTNGRKYVERELSIEVIGSKMKDILTDLSNKEYLK